MRFRTKVFSLFLLLAVLSSSLVVAFMWLPTRKLFFDLMSSNALSIAATIGAMLDPEDHVKLVTRADQDTPLYHKVEQALRRARDANRRPDLHVKYIYTMRPVPGRPNSPEFVVDAEEPTSDDKSNLGDIYKPSNKDYVFHVNDYQADKEFINDQWGSWLTANAPIRTPDGNAVAAVGVDVSANDALANLNGLFLWGAAALGLSVLVAFILASIASNRIAAPLIAIRNALERVSAGDYSSTIKIDSKDEFGEVAETLNKMTAGLQQREDLKSALARYVSEDILTEVIYAGKSSDLFSQRKNVTVLFADVRGFTAFSEQLSPEETVAMLNDYFEKMIDAIFKNGGHLNKFMGDGLMALFGALRDDDHQEEHAVQAALDMRAALKELQEKWSASRTRAHEALAGLRIGIGVNTGMAIVGNIGSKQRMEFTAIGDAVNLAARLEQATRDKDRDILVSEFTFVAARSRFPFEAAGDIVVKGKAETVRTYTIKT